MPCSCLESSLKKTLSKPSSILHPIQQYVSKPSHNLPGIPYRKTFTTSPLTAQDTAAYTSTQGQPPPRWLVTPPRMRAPFRSKPPVYGNDFTCNEDPGRLDRAYIKTLGKGGNDLLTEDVKWLAVTHKSFDHGRRGFNDRLAYLGTRDLPCGRAEQKADSKQVERWSISSCPLLSSTALKRVTH